MREEIDQLREEARDALLFLCAMIEQQKGSKHPQAFDGAIKRTRSKTLGLYRRLLNSRAHIDKNEMI